MSTTVNGHTVPTSADIRDTNKVEEWDALETVLTDLCTAINTSGQISSGATLAGGITLGGDLTATGVAVDVDLKDNDSSAISFDAAGKAGILNIDTTNSSEKVTMSGGLDVTGTLDIDGDINASTNAIDVDLKDNTASAISFDAAGKSGILEIDTTDSSEQVKFSGDIDVTGDTKVASIITDANVGTANTGVTAVEYGDGHYHKTTLTVSQTDALTIADNSALADGYLLYTLPAGSIVIHGAYMSMAMTAASTEAQSDTPDVGLGTLLASDTQATLDADDAACENILTGQTAADANGTATVKTVGTQLVIESGDAHTVYFNVADTWADDTGGDLSADIAGTVVLIWSFMA